MILRPRHVRTRLALWYLVLLGGILAMFIAGTCGVLFLNLRRELDHELADHVENIEEVLSFDSDGKLKISRAGALADPHRFLLKLHRQPGADQTPDRRLPRQRAELEPLHQLQRGRYVFQPK